MAKEPGHMSGGGEGLKEEGRLEKENKEVVPKKHEWRRGAGIWQTD